MTKPIPSSHRALSSGALQHPARNYRIEGLAREFRQRKAAPNRRIQIIDCAPPTEEQRRMFRIVWGTPKGARPEVYVIERKR